MGKGNNTRPGTFTTPMPYRNGTWSGRMEGTNERTFFTTAGGNNCRHSIMAVSVFSVPKAQIEQAIELGFYKPTEFELELLDL